MARRLLSGTGCATLTAYRYGGVCSQIALHALDSDGRVLVAARPLPEHPLASLDDDEIAEVRLDAYILEKYSKMKEIDEVVAVSHRDWTTQIGRASCRERV